MNSRNKKLLFVFGIFFVILAGFVLAGVKQGYFNPPKDLTVSLSPVTAIPGTVVDVDVKEYKLTLLVKGTLADNPDLAERIVRFSLETPVTVEVSKKDIAVYEAENDAYRKALWNFTSLSAEEQDAQPFTLKPPTEYSIADGSISDLIPGKEIFVYTQEDVMEIKEFQAEKIHTLYKQ